MKKYFALLTVILLGVSLNQAVAQNSATVNINLSVQQSIIVDVASRTVNIDIDQPEDYVNGKASTPINNHLQVVSSGGFTISATALGNFMNGADNIPLSALTITPGIGSSTVALIGELSTPATAMVATVAKTIITSTGGSADAKFPINYGISAGTGGVNLINKPEGTYTTTITYTIAAL